MASNSSDGPERMETVSEAVERLAAAGYVAQFRAVARGLSPGEGTVCEPEHLVVDEFVRFEGASNPDDEAIVFALHDSNHDIRGTYTVAYGPEIDPLDAEMVRRLQPWIPDRDPGLARHGAAD
jgi:hypothetical protein